jgi:DNA-binding IclR family transcriptional regulator
MAVQHPPVNEGHTPSPSEEKALQALKAGRDDGQPWGRVNPMYLREVAEMKKSTAEYALRQLHTAGWVRKPADGLYELVADPRED